MGRSPYARSSQTSTGDENLSRAMKPMSAGPSKGQPQGDEATAGAKGPARDPGPMVAKWSPGKVSNPGLKIKA